MKHILKSVISYLYNITLVGILLMTLWTGTKIFVLNIIPTNFWFHYQTVKPTQTVFNDNDELTFNSIRKIKRNGINLEYNDTLYCNIVDDENENFRWFSSSETSEKNIAKTDKYEVGSWRYEQVKPTPPRTCYMESTICVELPYGIDNKCQTLIGENFLIQ